MRIPKDKQMFLFCLSFLHMFCEQILLCTQINRQAHTPEMPTYARNFTRAVVKHSQTKLMVNNDPLTFSTYFYAFPSLTLTLRERGTKGCVTSDFRLTTLKIIKKYIYKIIHEQNSNQENL